MIDKIAAKSGLSLLKWLPAVAAAAFVVGMAPEIAFAQAPSPNGYVVTGCGAMTDNGTYTIVSTLDFRGNPYYWNAASDTYLYSAQDDQENRDYYRWYIGTDMYTYNGVLGGGGGDDYETFGHAGYFGGQYNSQGQLGWVPVAIGPSLTGWYNDGVNNDYVDVPVLTAL